MVVEWLKVRVPREIQPRYLEADARIWTPVLASHAGFLEKHVWRDASNPNSIVPGAVVVAGTERFWSVVRIEKVDDDGQVHFVAIRADDPAAALLLSRNSAA